MKNQEYFEKIIQYEDKSNVYHPDQMDKNENIEFIKVAYRAMFESLEFQKKNMALNYLEMLKKEEKIWLKGKK